MLTLHPSLAGEIGVSLLHVDLLMLPKQGGDREALPARLACPGFLARVSPFVDVEVGRQLVGLSADVAAEGTLIGV